MSRQECMHCPHYQELLEENNAKKQLKDKSKMLEEIGILVQHSIPRFWHVKKYPDTNTTISIP